MTVIRPSSVTTNYTIKRSTTDDNKDDVSDKKDNSQTTNTTTEVYTASGADTVSEYNKYLLGLNAPAVGSTPATIENPDEYFANQENCKQEDYTAENLEKTFPKDMYNIKKIEVEDEFGMTQTQYVITDKKSGKEVVTVASVYGNTEFTYKQEDGSEQTYSIRNGRLTSIEDDKSLTNYDANGNVRFNLDKSANVATYYDKDGNLFKEKNMNTGKTIEYDNQGNVTNVIETKESLKATAEELHKNLENNSLTKNLLEDLLKDNVTEWNVIQLIDSYKQNYGENLLEAISNQQVYGQESIEMALMVKDAIIAYYDAKGIYTDDINEMMTAYIENQGEEEIVKLDFAGVSLGALLEYETQTDELGKTRENKNGFLERLEVRLRAQKENDGAEANGKVDVDYSQGGTGDCWLVSAIKSIASDPETQAMLNDLITVDEGGNVIVDLKHVGKTYYISKEELSGADEYSSGDKDVRALEIAVNRYFHEVRANMPLDDIDDGNFSGLAFDILLGTNTTNKDGYSHTWLTNMSDLKKFLEGIGDEAVAVVSSKSYTGKSSTLTTVDGREAPFAHGHAYTVKYSDDKYIYLINPWKTEEVLKVSYKEFFKKFDAGYKADMDDIRAKNPELAMVNGGMLEEVQVIGKAGDNVKVYQDHTFTLVTDDKGYTYYQIRDTEGNLYFMPQELCDMYVEAGFSATTIVDIYAKTSIRDVQAYIKKLADRLLARAKTQEGLKETETAKEGTHFEGVGLNFDDYVDEKGNVDINKLMADWKKNGGEIYNYDDKSAQAVYSALLKAMNNENYNNFWKNAANYDEDPFENIDNFKFMSWVSGSDKSANISGGDDGGYYGSSGGGNGPLDWKNAGLSLMDADENKKTNNRVPIMDDQDCEE